MGRCGGLEYFRARVNAAKATPTTPAARGRAGPHSRAAGGLRRCARHEGDILWPQPTRSTRVPRSVSVGPYASRHAFAEGRRRARRVVLLAPEAVIELNAQGAEVLSLCDGTRTEEEVSRDAGAATAQRRGSRRARIPRARDGRGGRAIRLSAVHRERPPCTKGSCLCRA